MWHNVGTTYFSIALSNFLCNKKNESVAYIELNASSEIRYINKEASGKPFSSLGIRFYPEVTLNQLPEILEARHSYFVIDFGVLNNTTIGEFTRCDTKIILCECTPWKYGKFFESYQKYYNYIDMESVIILGKNEIQDSLIFPKQMQLMPYLLNPFQIDNKNFSFFEKLLERN